MALCAASASTASAAVTTSSVTAPTDRSFVEYNYDLDNPLGGPAVSAPENDLTISGTTDGTAADTVDVGCQYLLGATPTWKSLADGVPLAADGSFTTTVHKDDLAYGVPCTIRAIPGDTPAGSRPTLPVGAFAGHTAPYGYVETYHAGTANRLRDLYIARTQSKGFFDYDSAGSCGVDDSAVFTNTTMSDYFFYCGDYFYKNFNATRNGVQVDGKRAYLPDDVTDSKPGAPVLSFSRSIDPTTGDLKVVEQDDVVRCDVPADTTAADQCPTYSPTGLRLQRTITQDHDGRQTQLADDWVSTDGAAHQLDVIEEEDFKGTTTTFKAGWEGTDYAPRAGRDIFSAPPAGGPSTVYGDSNGVAADSSAFVQGAVTYASQPGAFTFGGTNYYYARYLKSVPAGGKTSIVQVYSQSDTKSELSALVAEATTRLTPPAPAQPQTVTQTTVVPGAAPPAKVITVPTPQCVIPKLVGLTSAKAKAALTKAKCKVGKTTSKRTRISTRIGKVTSASKQVGGAWKVGTTVNLVVGKKAKRAAKKAASK